MCIAPCSCFYWKYAVSNTLWFKNTRWKPGTCVMEFSSTSCFCSDLLSSKLSFEFDAIIMIKGDHLSGQYKICWPNVHFNHIPHLSAIATSIPVTKRKKKLTLNHDACNIPTAVYVNYKKMFTVMVLWQVTFLKRSSTNFAFTHCTSFHRINEIKQISKECFLNTKVHQDKGYNS